MASYIRVLPRDLFNESSLLKCYGRLWILLENANNTAARFETADVDEFDIAQDDGSGNIHVSNIIFTVRGERGLLTRPLNSRDPWPLYLEMADRDPIAVFDGVGNLSAEMQTFITRG